MARFTNLADELILLILLSLDQSSLSSLSREGRLIVCLVNTLLKRPSLAAKVQHLTFHNPDHTQNTTVSGEELSVALKFIFSIEGLEYSDQTATEEELLRNAKEYPDEVWYGNIQDGAVRPYLAILLGLVPNLKWLSIVERVDGGEQFTLPALFGQDEQGIHSDLIPDIGYFPSLLSLQLLRVHGRNFSLATWYALPNLRTLELDCYHDFNGMEIDTVCRHEPDLGVLHTLVVRCSACLLLPMGLRDLDRLDDEWPCPENPFESLRYFTLPKCLHIEIVNVAKVWPEDGWETGKKREDLPIIGPRFLLSLRYFSWKCGSWGRAS
ncbi:hypothetical protein BCR34DRAFT_602570 [Clohesyomyces aquaticus]|uniref:F-box domain-containing protein n=1 Tax=Clohesyomyces aquaticus TaxID=1231657 RepID=A0A1Y1ZII2_9PLEO|nr:hypothetical protein BCR34DRAFT_602570 [Clohesyomyces aquaticus]